MDLRVSWSRFAETKLIEIFEYYKVKANVKVARKIVSDIVDETIRLEKLPEIGQVETLLKNLPIEIRYLVSSNYKIIYRINLAENTIVILNVFDTRQNPLEIKKF